MSRKLNKGLGKIHNIKLVIYKEKNTRTGIQLEISKAYDKDKYKFMSSFERIFENEMYGFTL